MSSYRFSLVGDSNVKNNMISTNCRDRPLMSNAQVIPCGKLQILAESLLAVKEDSNVCVISCITNFLTSSDPASQVSHRVEPVLKECFDVVASACLKSPDVSFLLCPPMYRSNPYWYRDGMPEILRRFSDVMSASTRPPNLLLMPSFPTPSFQDDGVHLTAYSGLEFVLHLFDSAVELLTSQILDQDEKSARASESTRVLEDRVMALEQDHRRLSVEVASKSIVDSELACFQANLCHEDHIVMSGLKRISSKLSPKEWQVQAVQDVQVVLSIHTGKNIPIVFVKNSTGAGKDAVTTYLVKLTSVQVSKDIRTSFKEFFTGGTDTRPPALKGISIRNCVTPATQVRHSLLRLLGERYVNSNPGSKFILIRYEPRPMLKLFPAADASDKRVKSFNYVEAIRSLPIHFTEEELMPILQKVSLKLKGTLKATFGVIDDDMLRKVKRAGPQGGSGGSGSGKGRPQGGQGAKGNRGSRPQSRNSDGNDQARNSSSQSRNGKRGASSSPSGPSSKK